MTPKVSICMPNYNFAQYLPEAIESVLKQSYTNYEFIIIDNCSTDNSADIIKRYAESDSRIQFGVNEHNVGLVNNLNLCLKKAQGEYIKFLFSDDMLASDKAVERMVSVLDSDHEIALVATSRYLIDDRSTIKKVLSEYHGKTEYAGTEIIQDCLIEQKNKIGEPSVVMFRRKHTGRGFDGRYRQAVDLEMWFHILEQGKFYYLDEPLCSFREHPRQQTHVNISDVNVIEEPFLLLQDYADKPYVRIPRCTKEYMLYVPVYAIWKLYKKKRISKQDAITKIKEHYNYFKFILCFPFFKVYKFIKRSTKSMAIETHKRTSSLLQHKDPERDPYLQGDALKIKNQYYEYTRKEILPLLPDSPSKVLEIGCGAGNTLVWLKSLKHCTWIAGVEISPEAAEIARERLDAVYPVNIEQNSIPIQEATLDLILCLDVLEHMIDPWEVVRRLHKLLKPGGALIVSIPNVRNKDVLFPLLFKGEWDYTDAGILDKTHLRFFVRDTAIRLVESSGLKVDRTISTGLGRSRKSQIVNALLPSLITTLFEKQYLIRGVRVD
ncbi:MAG TPA: glycosyltransferase [Nitrospirota bacterium]|nr:glycosyltransferase [Nitrospirota bacterium]